MEAAGELLHGEVLKDAFLGFLEAVMVGVEDPAGLFDVDIDVLEAVPGQIHDPVDGVLGCLGGHDAQLADFAFDLVLDLLGHVALLELFKNAVELAHGILFASQFLVNGLELFVEVVVALAFFHGLAHAGLDALLDGREGILTVEADEDLLHALRDIQDFEDLLLAREGHVDAGHDGVAERGSVPDGFKRLGSVLVEGTPAGFDIGLKLGREEVGGSGEALLVAHHVFGRGDHDRGIVAVKGVVRESRPVKSFHYGFHIAVGQVQKLQDLADAAHGEESVAPVDFFLAAVFLGDHEDEPGAFGGKGGLDSPDGAFAPHEKRHDGVRKDDHIAERHDRTGNDPSGLGWTERQCGHANLMLRVIWKRKETPGRKAVNT